ncbi:glycoside hydrolase family 13 protein [Aliagarivorans marinus]|uniref:glycoside hydrolase family 13 protein n=1 Tax=Aliagarivorans marinus TaxID=561965 RepID=UPI000418728F|nr:alpha-glucosidase [Aliagarivorans marinus]
MERKWWHNAVVYQIYPRSFCDSNADGVGDIPGIISKLSHIEELGANVIWLSPVYASPMKDNGYDISDYYEIAPEYGSMADMEELITECSKRNIRIIMDLVANHTSEQHPWFIESKSSKENEKRDWYIWKPAKGDGSEPNNWESFFTKKAWTYDNASKQYYLHLFAPSQPDLNWHNPQVRQAIYQVMHFWLRKGISGFRMDVINMIAKPSDFPDATIFDEGVAGWEHWANNHGCHQYLREMYREVLSHYDVLTVGETPFTTPLDGRYYSHPARNELSMIFQFDHVSIDREEHNARALPFSLLEYKQVMSKWQLALHGQGWNSVYWSNHDQPRAVSRYGDDSPRYRETSAKMLATVLHCMSGTPYIYQGEEIAMTNQCFSDISEYNDLMAHFHYQKILARGDSKQQALDFLNRFSRDHARCPVHWNKHENAGFSQGVPWLSINPNYLDINAETARANPNSTFHHYRALIALRQSPQYGDTITYGHYQLLDPEDSEVYAYLRYDQHQCLLIVANFTAKHLERSYQEKLLEVLLSNISNTPTRLTGLKLEPYAALVMEVDATR